MWLRAAVVTLACLAFVACFGGGSGSSVTSAALCADVVAVATEPSARSGYTFSVTVRSDDTGWDGYADRWEVVVDGVAVGTRVLAHPHVDEQPFTRSQRDIEVVVGAEVLVRAHHTVGGWCGVAMTVLVSG